MNKPKFEIYRDAMGDWRWRFRAGNGLIMADSAEAYINRRNCVEAAEKLRELLDLFPDIETKVEGSVNGL